MTYQEWIGPPPSWWLLSVLFSLSCCVAVLFYLGPVAGVVTLLVAQALVTALFLGTALRLRLSGEELQVGRAVLDLAYVRAVAPLDADAAARRTGPEADARAHLVMRPYVRSAVELTLDDPADPVPYWVLATRRPARLSEAVAAVLARDPRPAR